MFISEIDSFIYKFRNLLLSGKDARLEIKSESGKATVNLTAEVDIPSRPPFQARNGPARHSAARQRRRDRRATARAAAAEAAAGQAPVGAEAVAADDVTVEKEEAAEAITDNISDVIENEFEDAVEARDLEVARAFEPADEIVNEFTTDEKLEKICESVSVIPIRKVNADDDTIEKLVKEKFAVKDITIFEFCIHRSVTGTFIRFDARIGPTKGKFLEKTDFGFSNCRVISLIGSE